MIGLPLLVGAYLVPETTYLSLYRSEKTIDLDFVWVGLIVYTGFVVGSSFAISLGSQPQERDIVAYCRWVVWLLFSLTLFAYVVGLAYSILQSGGVGPVADGLYSVLFDPSQSNADYMRSEVFPTIPGVTTLVHCSILYATVEALLWVRKATPRRYSLARYGTVFSFVLAHSILLSERLALIQVTVPVVVILGSHLYGKARYRNPVRLAPVFFVAGVFGLFAAGEYFRSWDFYRPIYGGSYMQFAVDRFLGYYATALNNAAVIYQYDFVQPFSHTFVSLFRFPVLGGLVNFVYEPLFGSADYEQTFRLLSAHANPEFNNVAPLGLWLNEFSVFLAPIAAFVIGLVASSLYNGFLKGRLIGVLLYPSWFIGLLEISRVYYWANQRYFPVLAFLLFSLIAFRLFKLPADKPPAKGRVGKKMETIKYG